jgi:hypothetical protein
MVEATSPTLLVSIAASIMVLFLSPVHGLIVYLAAFAYYPTYLSVSLGTINFTVSRIVILAILAKLFLRTDLPGRFRFVWLDKLVLIYFATQILVGATTAKSLEVFLQNRAGAVFDMVLPYFAVRLIITNKDRYLILLKGILFSAAPLAIFGFYQCLTGRNPLDFIPGQRYYELPMRFGFYRATLTFSHSIMFGLYFAMLGPVCAGLWYSIRKNRWLYIIAISLMALGVFSSMSSGPFLAALLATIFIAFYRYRRYWRPALAVIILMCGIVEIISNRHFYDVLGDFTFNSQTAWYRSKLIDVALFQGGMSGHWLTGFGEVDPGWAPKIDGRDHTDIVNQYILVLSCYGLTGLIPFIAVIVAALKIIFEVLRAGKSDFDTWLTWCILGTLSGLLCAFTSVSLFAQPTTVFFMILGFVGSLPLITYENSSLGKLSEAVKWCHIEKPQTVNT